MLENTQATTRPVESDFVQEQQFRVKLYHPHDESVWCKMSGKSEYTTIPASDMPQVRTRIESDTHEIFKGDTCKICGALAKISVTVIAPTQTST